MAETRAYTAETNDVDRDARTVVATINTDAVDRYMTVVDPSGAQLENYRKNPVVLFNHGDGDGSTPIGKNLWIKANKNRLIAKTQFVPAGMDPLADRVFELYAQGFLSAWSVSFAPIDAGLPTPDELRAKPALADCRCIYRKWDLLEYSCVTIPGNPEAVRQARSLGLILPGWPDEEAAPAQPPAPTPEPPTRTQPELPPLRGRTMPDVERAVVSELTRQMGSTEQVARDLFDLARGQV